MCGIVGIFGTCPSDGDDLLRRMLRLIGHRGPDEAGIYLSDRLCMGTVRLSIVGIATGQQPLCDSMHRYSLCYNGEIYNYIELRNELKSLGYSFYTESDTEVVLQSWRAWGAACLRRFNGAFAFALYDAWQDVLYLARDRYGKRPLFYAPHGDTWLFGSEMKAFLAAEDFEFEFDTEQLASILTLWTTVGSQSAYKGIRQVPQASFATVSKQGVKIDRYFQLDFTTPHSVHTEQEAIEQIEHAIREAVNLRLRGDVEVGMYLSGGLDSSILASTVASQVNNLRTYSVQFADTELDESADQLRMASHIGSKHRMLNVTDEMIVEHFPSTVYHTEVPIFRTAPVPMYLLSRMVRDDGIKVVITGEGADEAFLGYDLFKETLLRSEWNSLEDAKKLFRLSLLHPYLRHYRESASAELLGLYGKFATENYPGLFSHELRIQNGLFSQRLLRQRTDGLKAIRAMFQTHTYYQALSTIEKAQWLEYQTLLPGYLLSSQGDRMSLAHSVENRCPFLDPNVVALSAAVNLKFDDGTDEKYLLRKAFANQLPPENVSKRKHPYRAPDGKAFAASPPDYLELLLSESELKKNELLDPAFCSRLTAKILRSGGNDITTKENQTFIFLLSIALQHYQFVRRNVSAVIKDWPIENKLSRVIDRRTSRERYLERS